MRLQIISQASCEHFNSNTSRATTEQQQAARRISLCLGATQSLALLLAGLEPSMAKLGGCVDELELDVLESPAGSLREQALSEGDAPLSAAWNLALHVQHMHKFNIRLQCPIADDKPGLLFKAAIERANTTQAAGSLVELCCNFWPGISLTAQGNRRGMQQISCNCVRKSQL